MSDAKCTLAHKKNVKDAEAKKQANLAKIQKVTGVAFTVETDPPTIDQFVVKLIHGGANYHEKVGDYLYGDSSYLNIVHEL